MQNNNSANQQGNLGKRSSKVAGNSPLMNNQRPTAGRNSASASRERKMLGRGARRFTAQEVKAYRRSLRSRIKGKPSSSQSPSTIVGLLGGVVSRSLKLILILLIILGMGFAGLGTGMLFGYISTAGDLDIKNISTTTQKTQLLDKDGNVINTLSNTGQVNREFVPYSELANTYIAKAFMAIEDERFMQHHGIDPTRIASAIFSALANGGTPTHGGSTITQQTVKLISGADDISAQRKIQEWYNAYRLEQNRSKEGVLDLYLNLVPMANNIVGVQAASKAYFNKDAKELNIEECALLASIPNMPSVLNPRTEYGRRNALRRMRLTLGKMYELGFIDDAQYQDARTHEINFDFSSENNAPVEIRSYFADYVIESVINDLVKELGYSYELAEMTVYSQGLTIETTMDQKLQARLDEVYKDESLFTNVPWLLEDSPEHPQSSIVVIENNPDDPGRIRGMVGGYGEKKKNSVFNRATDAYRQPGSSIKPILVYGPALDTNKITQNTIFNDRPMYLNPEEPDTPWPLNFSRSYMGQVNLHTALVASLNTIAVDVFTNWVTPSVALEYLKRMGIDRTNDRFPSMAIGGFTKGVNTKLMAGAYATLANKGIYTEPTVYKRVLKADGSVLLDKTHPQQTRVFREQVTSVLTPILTSIANNNGATPYNQVAAGKTGTTDDDIDKWFCGYTPYYTAAVWYGYDNNSGRRTEIPSADLWNAIGLWRASMTAIHQDLPYKNFETASYSNYNNYYTPEPESEPEPETEEKPEEANKQPAEPAQNQAENNNNTSNDDANSKNQDQGDEQNQNTNQPENPNGGN